MRREVEIADGASERERSDGGMRCGNRSTSDRRWWIHHDE